MEIKEMVAGYAEDDSNVRLLAGIAAGETFEADYLEEYGLTQESEFYEALDSIALEVETIGKRSYGAWQISAFRVVTGTGGPHVEFEVESDGDVTQRAFWGSERAEQYLGRFPGLFEALGGDDV